jgi:PEP-CTERM motif
LNFYFSVTNTVGDVPGTFTGEIFGLTDNATSSASSVVIQSIPAGMNNLVSPPIDATLWDQQYQNSFQVVNGQVVDGGFWAQQTVNGFLHGYQLYINGADGPYNFLNLDGVDDTFVRGDDGLAAANITPASVPEPASCILAGLGAMCVAGYTTMRRRREGASA